MKRRRGNLPWVSMVEAPAKVLSWIDLPASLGKRGAGRAREPLAIYRRLLTLLIATLDEFAGLPWIDRAGSFFGHVDREDQWGFYGPGEPKEGKRLHNGWRLDPPDLIIQDELHLISGPLDTVAGLYETVLDWLSSHEQGDKVIRPKIVASTATVRRADQQIQALFDREHTEVFRRGRTGGTTSSPGRWRPATARRGFMSVSRRRARARSWYSCGRS